MSARDDLHALAAQDMPVTGQEADEAIDAYRAEVLREAAEKIRQHWYPRFPGKADYTQGMDAGYDRAADLIDPEVTP